MLSFNRQYMANANAVFSITLLQIENPSPLPFGKLYSHQLTSHLTAFAFALACSSRINRSRTCVFAYSWNVNYPQHVHRRLRFLKLALVIQYNWRAKLHYHLTILATALVLGGQDAGERRKRDREWRE